MPLKLIELLQKNRLTANGADGPNGRIAAIAVGKAHRLAKDP